MGRRVLANNTSGYRGVFGDGGRWRARGYKDGRRVNLGRYDTAAEAARAYDAWARQNRGARAHLNFAENSLDTTTGAKK